MPNRFEIRQEAVRESSVPEHGQSSVCEHRQSNISEHTE
jgi:hypothetical protein